MPLPMIHLATAREYAHDISWLCECSEFYLGIISPNAIHNWFDSGESQHRNPIKYFSIEDLMEFSYEAGRRIQNSLSAEGL